MKHFLWKAGTVYGYVFGWPMFRWFHYALIKVSLHGLGYDDPHCTGEERFIKGFLKDAGVRVCVDVGANVGGYTDSLLKAIPGVEVYAVEPAKATFAALKERHGHEPSVHLYQLALSDTDGEVTFYSTRALSETASLSPTGGDMTETVQARTFDSFAELAGLTDVDLVKIDTEGYEREILSTMSMRPRIVQFEFNRDHLLRGVTLLSITQLLPGYRFYRLLPHGMVRIHPDKFIDNIFIFSNVIAVRE